MNIYDETIVLACFNARPATKDIDAIFNITRSLIIY